ncbi:2415_t:CDS:2, partial [Scutellospora calospora]
RIKSPRTRSRNKISKTTPVAALPGSIVDTLVTFNSKKGRYERILNKNGKICKRYPEGIFVEHISRNGGFWKNIIYSSILQEVAESFENIEYYNTDLRIFFKYINCKQYFLKSKLKIEKNNDEETDEETDSDKEIECLCEEKNSECNFFEWEVVRCYCNEVANRKKVTNINSNNLD